MKQFLIVFLPIIGFGLFLSENIFVNLVGCVIMAFTLVNAYGKIRNKKEGVGA